MLVYAVPTAGNDVGVPHPHIAVNVERRLPVGVVSVDGDRGDAKHPANLVCQVLSPGPGDEHQRHSGRAARSRRLGSSRGKKIHGY
eukprot:scaffold2114_cov95-Isochrysis_galbana.AAC.4